MEEINFEKELKHLEEIMKKMEDKNTSLDESIALHHEGMEIIKKLENKLNDAEGKVNTIIKK